MDTDAVRTFMKESLFGDPLECIPDERMYGYCQEIAHMLGSGKMMDPSKVKGLGPGEVGEGVAERGNGQERLRRRFRIGFTCKFVSPPIVWRTKRIAAKKSSQKKRARKQRPSSESSTRKLPNAAYRTQVVSQVHEKGPAFSETGRDVYRQRNHTQNALAETRFYAPRCFT